MQKVIEAMQGWKLARFELFSSIEIVWEGKKDSLKNAAEARNIVVSDLSNELISAIARGDEDTFRSVAETLKVLKTNPRRQPENPLSPIAVYDLDYWLLTYYLNRRTATIDELIEFCSAKLDWKFDSKQRGNNRAARDQQIRRRCQALDLPIVRKVLH